MIKSEIYLDSAASTKIDPRVEGDIIRSIKEDWYNPSAVYEQGKNVRRKIEHAREQVKSFLHGFKIDELIFCSSGSEANNLAIKGFMEANENPLLITTMTEHSSINNLAEKYYYNRSLDFGINYGDVIFCNVTANGRFNTEDLKYILKHIDTINTNILVTTSWINNETGVMNDIKEIANIIHEYGGYLLVDCSQGIGHLPFFINEYMADMVTFTSEKMYMPRGCGVLYKDNRVKINSQILGGPQENGYKAGTENQYMITALGNQCERLSKEYEEIRNKEVKLYRLISDAIANACKDICEFEFNFKNNVPNILSVRFKGYENIALISLLSEYGVMCSAGSACNAGDSKPSRVLNRIGFSDEDINNTIRFSFDYTLKEEDIKEFETILRKCLSSLKI